MRKIELNQKERLAKATRGAKGIITPALVSSNLKVSQQEAGRLLARWSDSGWVERVRRGVYVPLAIDVLPHQIAVDNVFAIANKLYGPGYIGGFTAIKYWDLSEQLFETITFFTEKKVANRNPKIGNTKLKIKTISSSKNFGTKSFWQDSIKLLVSDPTKTIADLLDDPKIGGGMRVVYDFFKAYRSSEYANYKLLIKYLNKNGNRTAFKRLGLLLELEGDLDSGYVEEVKNNISPGYSKFDTTLKNDKIISRWNLKVPSSWKKEYDRKK